MGKYGKLFLAGIFFAAALLMPAEASAISAEETEALEWSEPVEVTEGDYICHARLSEDGKYAWLVSIEQAEKKKISRLILPETVDGAQVIALGEKAYEDECKDIFGNFEEPYHNVSASHEGIKSVEIPSSVTVIYDTAFAGFCDLTQAEIPDGVETLSYGLFFDCESLKSVKLPENLKTIKSAVFQGCKKLTEISISKNSEKYRCKDGFLLSKNGKKLIIAAAGLKTADIPSGVKTVESGAFEDSYAKTVSIPESVTLLKKWSLSGKKIQAVTVSEKNPRYALSSDCIYDKKEKSLAVAISRNGSVIVPKEVKYLTGRVSAAGKVKSLFLPETLKALRKNCMNAFSSYLRRICFSSKTPPQAAKKGALLYFSTCYVPKESLKQYKKWWHTVTEDDVDGFMGFVGY